MKFSSKMKKISKVALSCGIMMCGGLALLTGVVAANTDEAASNMHVTNEKGVIKVDRADINLANDSDTLAQVGAKLSVRTGNNPGMRFKYVLSSETIKAVAGDVDVNSLDYGILLARKDLLDNAGVEDLSAAVNGVFTDTSAASLSVSGVYVMNSVAANKVVSEADVTFASVINGFENAEQFHTQFSAVGYVSDGTNVYFTKTSSASYSFAVSTYIKYAENFGLSAAQVEELTSLYNTNHSFTGKWVITGQEGNVVNLGQSCAYGCEEAGGETKTKTLAEVWEIGEIGSASYNYTFVDNGDGSYTSNNKGVSSGKAAVAYKFGVSGTFSFDYSVSSESGWDVMFVYIDGNEYCGKNKTSPDGIGKSQLSGVNSGTISVPVEAGQTVRVTYEKDNSGNSNDDTAIISNINFAPNSTDAVVVNVETNGGTPVQPIVLYSGATLQDYPETSKENKFFDLWYTDEACTIPFDKNNPITSDMTLYAKWLDDANPLMGTYKGYNVYGERFSNNYSEIIIDASGNMSGTNKGSAVNGKVVSYDEETGEVSWLNLNTQIINSFVYDSLSETFMFPTNLTSTSISTTDFMLYTNSGENDLSYTVLGINSIEDKYNYKIKIVEITIGDEVKTILTKDGKIYSNVTCSSLFIENFKLSDYSSISGGYKSITDLVVKDKDGNTILAVGYNGNNCLEILDSVYGIYANGENTLKLNGFGKVIINDAEGTYTVNENGIVYADTGDSYYHITLNDESFEMVKPMSTVVFESNGGTSVDSITVNTTKQVGELVVPTKEGSVFMGWFTSPDFAGSAIDSTYAVTEDITVYAKWLDEVVLSFDSNEGTTVEDISNPSGLEITVPTSPTKEGYRFDGWYTDDETFLNPFSFEDGITENTTVYAKWVKQWTITINPNNGSESVDVLVDEGANYVIPMYIKTGSKLEGWFTTSTFEEGSEYVSGTAVSNDIAIYAKWVAGAYSNDAANMIYEAAGEENGYVSSVMFECTYPWAVTSYDNDVWMVSTNQNKGGSANASDISFVMADNAILKFDYIVSSEANWDILYVYINGVEYCGKNQTTPDGIGKAMLSGENSGTITLTVSKGDVVKISYQKDGSTDKGKDCAYVNNFVFIPADEVAVTYNYNDGITENTVTSIASGTAIILPTNPSREGYVFLGWYTDEACTVKYANEIITADTVLYAGWFDASQMQGASREDAVEISQSEQIEYTNYNFLPNQTEMWLKVTITKNSDIRGDYIYMHSDYIENASLKNNLDSITIYKNDETEATKTVTSFYSDSKCAYTGTLELVHSSVSVAGETVFYIHVQLKEAFTEVTSVGFELYLM